MRREKIIALLCPICVLSCFTGFAQDTTAHVTYNLQQCVDIAIKNNPDVKQAGFSMQSDKIYWQQARVSMLPGISASASRSINNGKSVDPYTNAYVTRQNTADNYGLTASVVLWHGSSLQNFIRQQSLAYQAGKMDWQQEKDQVTINVILDYLDVLNEQEQLKIAQQQVEEVQQQVQELTVRNEKGDIAPSDLYKMRGQLEASQLTVLSTRNALVSARLTLAQLMNIPYDAGMELEPLPDTAPVSYDATIDDIYAYALKNLALVKAAGLHEESARHALKSARGSYFPTLSLSGGLYTNYSSAASSSVFTGTTDEATGGYVIMNNIKSQVYAPVSHYDAEKVPYSNQWKNNFSSGISLNLSIPILNGLQTRTQVKSAKIAVQQAAFQRSTVETQLRQAIERDYVNMTTAYETYRKLSQQVQDYAEMLRESNVKFKLGAINSVELVIAQNDLQQAELSLVSAKYNYIVQTKILDYYRGKLSW